MDTTPYWIDSAPLQRFGALDRDLDVDVVVIGAGITGITAAYLLKRAGQTVALVERGRCARVDTGHTTAHLTAVTDLSRQELAKSFGKDAARAVWDAGAAAIDQIVNNIRAEDISCDFRWVPGYLHVPFEGAKPEDREFLEKEAAAARELEIRCEFVSAIPTFGLPGVKFPHQALFHPRKYLAALVQRIPGGGSHVFEDSDISSVEEDPLTVRVGDHRLRCARVIMATHNPLMGTAGIAGATLFQSKLALYSSYAVAARLPKESIAEASFWDTAEPYNYLRVERKPDHDFAIFGGEDHKTGQDPDTSAHYRRLEARLLRLLPQAKVEHRWSGQVIDTNDGLPFIGELAKPVAPN